MDKDNPIYKLPSEESPLTEAKIRQIISEMMGNWTEPSKMSGSYFQSANYVAAVSGWRLTPTSGEINFALSVLSLNIPDTTTASSFHTDSSGNSWWGANVASGYLNANAYILATGAAVFKNVQIGGTTIQYVITNSGIFSFGDGSDGTVTFSDQGTAPAGTTKTDNTAGATIFRLDRDVYYNSATINATVSVNPNGYRIFVKDTLTVNGTINGNGTVGNAGAGGASSPSGSGANAAGGASVSMSDGYLKGSPATGAGGTGSDNENDSDTAGGNGTNTTNSLGSNAVNGGAGGNGGSGGAPNNVGSAGGTGGTRTASNVTLIANWHLATLLDVAASGSTVKFDNSASAAGGGGGGGGNSGSCTNPSGAGGGGGGSGGAAGRIVAIYARTITIGAAGIIRANGGNGGAGGAGGSTAASTGCGASSGGGGGGGAGGNGGIIVLTYNVLTNNGSITANAGTGGTGGTAGTQAGDGTTGTNGTAGQNGAAGVIYQFQLSL